MKLIGVTGGISVGKTKFTKILEGLGEHVIDVDELNREALEYPDVIEDIRKHFPEVVHTNKFSYGMTTELTDYVDRQALAKIVFADTDKLKILEGIIHPVVSRLKKFEIIKAGQRGLKFAFLSHPLLYKSGNHKMCQEVIVVKCDDKRQLDFLMTRSSLTEEEAKRRIEVQRQQIEYATPVTYVWNNSDHDALYKQALDILVGYHLRWQ